MIPTPILGIPIHVDKYLEYRCYNIKKDPPFFPQECLVMGTDAYAQLTYAMQVKPRVIETDPGPLDARVP